MKLYLILIIFSFMLLLGCASLSDSLSDEEKIFGENCIDEYYDIEVQSESKKIIVSEEDYCYFEIAKKFDKLNYCAFIDLTLYKDECYYYFAIAKNSEDLCFAIKGALEQQCLTYIRLNPLTEDDINGDYDYLR